MTWTASVLTKTNPAPGELRVQVRYTDGARTVDETYMTRGVPDADWIRQTATHRLQQLEAQDAFTVAAGAVTPLPIEPFDPNKAVFLARVQRLERLWRLFVVTGVLPATHAKIVALQDAIRADLATYVDSV
jgi:hypothetical protein